VKVIALLALCACVDVPTAGSIYECSATFICDGVRYEVRPQRACFYDEEEARAQWQTVLDKLAEQTTCAEESFEASCTLVWKVCRR
jgi:hypothetical protein